MGDWLGTDTIAPYKRQFLNSRKRVNLYVLTAFRPRPNTKRGHEATSARPIFPRSHRVRTPRLVGWVGATG